MYMRYPKLIKHMQCSDNRGACRYAYEVRTCMGACICMKLGGSGGMPPQGKFEVLGEIMLLLRPF